ncbi:ribosomal protein L1/ribosomal biogenesis protein [Blyttiomyces helicus]|uniref:Ribosomal L1 domain-containing protein 1 n=1 Tax=Blyttiomyces helicus TaxID=388810 RepID=A0A4V1IRE3_9FUNG|nr:ribosomal protein L1/ribosomal biogenesis protein [Blyttiomyces helicus]|eukprot:RKO89757.1 ribosomal protein L1/ribosomal biogenesis protein [Blyttiomyces helicus]
MSHLDRTLVRARLLPGPLCEAFGPGRVAKASKALLAYAKKQEAEKAAGPKPDLVSDADSFIHLVLTTRKISEKKSIKPQRIPLPHSIYGEDIEVCLFTKDPQREFKDLIQEKGVKSIARVIGISKLKAKFKPYEAKRQLCASYPIFLADERILPLLPTALGKAFFSKNKHPAPVDLTKGNLAGEISKAIGSTYLHLSPGACQ